MRDAPSNELSYIQSYDTNNTRQTLAGSFLQRSHELLEKTLPVGVVNGRVLEVGAGSGHHLPYLKNKFDQYVMTDGSDDMLKIASQKYSEQLSDKSLIIEKQDATSLSYPDHSFDRLIASCSAEWRDFNCFTLRSWHAMAVRQALWSSPERQEGGHFI
jgi:phosphatidylethanolamine/phosphatidyl-N-methylethanolamine N-methyltransferase